MKKILLLFLLFTIGTLHGLAQDFEFTASGINWQCTVLTDEAVSICGASSPTGDVEELIFPTSVTDDAGNDYTVTDLNWKGSLNLVFSNLTKVVLPKHLISISGNGVFRDCSLLTTIENTENMRV